MADRYFTNTRYFGDDTAYLRTHDGGTARHTVDGLEESANGWTLAECLRMVEKKHWKEITADEAASLIRRYIRK